MPIVRMMTISNSDQFRINAAMGWLGLDSVQEAFAELKQVSDAGRSHSSFLTVYYLLMASNGDWQSAISAASDLLQRLPFNPIAWTAYALGLRQTRGLTVAYECLSVAALRFPDDPLIAYILARFALERGWKQDASDWAEKALQTGQKSHIRTDPDKRALWSVIKRLTTPQPKGPETLTNFLS